MVIQKFNKLIRNKWVWGVFAIAISAFFAFDFLIADLDRDLRPEAGEQAGLLAGEPVAAADFLAFAEEVCGLGRNRDWKRKTGDVNRSAWETYAAFAIAEKGGFVATDAEVREAVRSDRSFAQDGVFSPMLYQAILRQNDIAPARYEAYLRHRITVMHIADAILGSAAWTSPVELDRAVSDMTDALTVRVATFTQEKADSDKVTLDEAGLRKWYDDNTNSLALPERTRIRLVRYDATDTNVLAKMTVTDDELRDYYDSNSEKYTTTDTNGVETVKKFEEVSNEVAKVCRRIAAVECFATNLNSRAYGVKAAKGSSRLDEIAKEDGKTVAESDWFSIEGGLVEGFMRPATSICPGAEGFEDAIAELDPTSEDLRYGVVRSERAVWLIEKSGVSKAHVPTFEEAKEIVRPRALRAAKLEAFKKAVEAIAAQGTNAVLAAKDVTTNVTFVVADLGRDELLPHQRQVAMAARKLMPGGVSEFTSVGETRAILVVCTDRKPGDAAKASLVRSQIQGEIEMLQCRQLPESWMKWNLERMGFEETDLSSTVNPPEDEE